MSVTIHVDVLAAAHTAVKTQIDAAGATAYINIRDSGDVLLSTLPLTYPCGTVSGTTGTLTLGFGARDEAAAASGTASYAELCDHAAKVLMELSCAAGTAAVADTCVLSSLSIVSGAPVEGVSATIG